MKKLITLSLFLFSNYTFAEPSCEMDTDCNPHNECISNKCSLNEDAEAKKERITERLKTMMICSPVKEEALTILIPVTEIISVNEKGIFNRGGESLATVNIWDMGAVSLGKKINLSDKSSKLGSFSIGPNLKITEGQPLEAYIEINKNRKATIVISSYDKVTKIIKGEFTMTFKGGIKVHRFEDAIQELDSPCEKNML